MVTYGPILRWSIWSSVQYYFNINQTRSNQIRTAALLHKISTVASLAHHGLLSSLESMSFTDVDLSSIPDESLASLVSCVNLSVTIENVKNCNSILDGVKSERLAIQKQTLTSEETRTLVKAMESKVEKVEFGLSGAEGVTLDLVALTQYSGQGKCQTVYWENIFFDKYEAELRNWVKRTDSELDEYESPMNPNPSVHYTLYMRWNFKSFCRLANFVLPFPII